MPADRRVGGLSACAQSGSIALGEGVKPIPVRLRKPCLQFPGIFLRDRTTYLL